MKKYKTILADPPWPMLLRGRYNRRPKQAANLKYPTMTVEEIASLQVGRLSALGCHLWLWTCNQFLKEGFYVLESWGFKYLAPITWVKPNGVGNYFSHNTQTILFGYKSPLKFNGNRFMNTAIFAELPRRHSVKPPAIIDYIESISPEPRIELFCRAKRLGWDAWGNEVESDIELIIGATSK